jgi:hypothetical protein
MDNIVLKACPFMKQSTTLAMFIMVPTTANNEEIKDIDMFIDA